eukprot:s429_g8.t1
MVQENTQNVIDLLRGSIEVMSFRDLMACHAGTGASEPEPGHKRLFLDDADALECFYAFLELMLEHYKERVCPPPAKYFFTVTGDLRSRDQVYSDLGHRGRLLFSARLGVSWAQPHSSSSEARVHDVWQCLSEAAWDLFLDPAYFGMDFADIPALRGGPPLLCSAAPDILDEDGRARLACVFAKEFQAEVHPAV